MAQPSMEQLMAANEQARAIVINSGVNMTQQIFTTTIPAANVRSTVLNIPVRQVGLLKRFYVEVTGAIVQAAAETLTRTTFNGSNIFSQIILNDLSNNVRINTTGWHMHILASARRQMPFASAYTTDSPVGIGSNFAVSVIPSPVTTTQNFRFFYEIPVSYTDFDLRGAIYLAVVNATSYLQLTVNPNFVVASTGNPTTAVYISSSTDLGTINNFTVKVFQNYIDQIPTGQGGPILPAIDLSTAYLLNNSVTSALVTGTDIATPYANFREFLSTTFIYDNFGSGQAVGAAVNYIGLEVANYTKIWQVDPFLAALWTRNILGDDFPAQTARETYYFDSRQKPISTIQYGNQQIIFNFSQVQAATSQLLVGFEAFAQINQVTQAGSLYNS